MMMIGRHDRDFNWIDKSALRLYGLITSHLWLNNLQIQTTGDTIERGAPGSQPENVPPILIVRMQSTDPAKVVEQLFRSCQLPSMGRDTEQLNFDSHRKRCRT